MGLCQSKSANTLDTSSNPTKIEKVEELSAASEKEGASLYHFVYCH